MSTARDQLLFDLFVTALEGGIGYWSHCSHYHHTALDAEGHATVDDLEGFYALVFEDDGDETPEHRVDRSAVAKGYRLATSAEWRNRIAWSSGEKPPLVVTDDTDWDFDAGDADVIVQLGLFGEVVYG